MRKTFLLTAGLLIALSPRTWADDDAKKLSGTWSVVAIQKDGNQTPPEKFQGKEVRITSDTITCKDKEGKVDMSAKYTLDTGGKPWHVSFSCTEGEHKGKKVKGIAKIEGDTLFICFASPDKDAPTDFKAGQDQTCITLKRTAQ